MVNSYLNGVTVNTGLSDSEVLSKLEGVYGHKIMDHIKVGIEQGALDIDEEFLRDIAEELLSQITGEYYVPLKRREEKDDTVDEVFNF